VSAVCYEPNEPAADKIGPDQAHNRIHPDQSGVFGREQGKDGQQDGSGKAAQGILTKVHGQGQAKGLIRGWSFGQCHSDPGGGRGSISYCRKQ
jgi:hypothetical protein